MEIYSTAKALWHVDRLKNLQKGRPISPTLLQIDLEAFCNDNCEFCSYRKEDGYNNPMIKLLNAEHAHEKNQPIGEPSDKSHLPKWVAEKLPQQLKEAGIPAVELTGGGEPTLWPYFDTLYKNLIKEGIEIGLVTNASTLPEKRLKMIAESKNTIWVRFSMDASKQEIHKKIHRTGGDDFERRFANVEKLAKWKHPDLTFGISFIITPDNRFDMQDAILKYKSVKGINNIRFSWMYDKTGTAGLDENEITHVKNRLEHYKTLYDAPDFRVLFERGRIETYDKPNDDFSHCYYQFFVANMGADGKLYPCCIMKYHPDYAYADIREKTLKEIYTDPDIFKKMSDIEVKRCFPCWLRNRNKQIGQGIEKPMHVNFV